MRRVAWWLLVVSLTLATIAAASVGGWQFVTKTTQSHPVADQPAARETVIKAASDATVRILSYTPDTWDEDNKAAIALLTGDFLESYRKMTNEVVGPAARSKGLTAAATVQRAGVENLTAGSATILLFIKQKTSSKESEPTETSSAVLVSLTKANGTWLVNQFNPV